MYNVGVVVGKFAPLTLGHINLITEACLHADRVVVVLCHSDIWLAEQNARDQKILTKNNKLRWLQQIYADSPNVEIRVIDESNIPQYPNGWREFSRELRMAVAAYPNESVCIFSSELEYDAEYSERFPDWTHKVVDSDRTEVPISATQIRSNLYANWQYLPSLVRQEYTLKVCIIGTESCGKTSMVKNLAKLFNTSWVEEYGRTYVETVLAKSEDTLRSDDYPIIAYRHKELELQAMRSANRVCIIDTNAFITEYYHRLYEGRPNPIVSAIAGEEKYDLVIYLGDNVPWIPDGMRSSPDRVQTRSLFVSMMEEFNVTAVAITAETYAERFTEAKQYIRQLLQDHGAGDL